MADPEASAATERDPSELLARSPLLARLDDRQRAEFARLATIIEVPVAGARIVREGEDAENFYMILAGEAEVLKRENDGEREFPIAVLGPNDHFGETALFRASKRTASIRARTPMILAMLKTREIREAPGEHGWLAGFLLELMRGDAQRMDRLTKQAVGGFSAERDGNQRQVALNRVLLYVSVGLSLYAIGVGIATQFASERVRELFTDGLYVALGAAMIWMMWRSPAPAGFFGFRYADDRRRELGEVAAATGALLLLALLVKLALIRAVPALAGLSLFATPEPAFVELVFALGYAAVMPVQEICVRGAMQSSLTKVFEGQRRGAAYAIVLANLLFAAMHSHLSPSVVLLVFVPGLIWGWLYARHRSLLGVSISHVLVAIWAMRVLGYGELLALL